MCIRANPAVIQNLEDPTAFDSFPMEDLIDLAIRADDRAILDHPDFADDLEHLQTRTMKGSRLRAKLSVYRPDNAYDQVDDDDDDDLYE